MDEERRPTPLVAILSEFTTEAVDLITNQTSPNQKEVELVETQISEFEKEAAKIKQQVEDYREVRKEVCNTLPLMREKADELQQVFDTIDSLEAFVTHVGECVTAMENRCGVIEQAQGGNVISRKLGSFFSAFSGGDKKKKPLVAAWNLEEAIPDATEFIDLKGYTNSQ